MAISKDLGATLALRSTFLELPKEIRFLIYDLCNQERWMVVLDEDSWDPSFTESHATCRQLFRVNHQIRDEVSSVPRRDLKFHFAGRRSFCDFLSGKWAVCSLSGRNYRGMRLGKKVGEATLSNMKRIRIDPGTTEVGYINLLRLSTWLPNLQRLELDLTKESIWAYSRDVNVSLNETVIKDINWRISTLFGVDASSLREQYKWTLVVLAGFMLPANPEQQSNSRVDGGWLRVEYTVDRTGTTLNTKYQDYQVRGIFS